MKKIAACLMLSVMSGTLSLSAVEKKWFPGAFPEDGTSRVSTLSEVRKTDDNATRYTFRFQTGKSGQAEVQFPVSVTGKNSTAVIIEAKGVESSPHMEVWLKDGRGSKFQGKIQTLNGEWKSFKFPLQDCSAADVRFVQLVIPNKDNGNAGSVDLRDPQWGQAPRKWYSGVFEDTDGKSKTSSVSLEGSEEDNGLSATFSFPGKGSGAAFIQTPVNGEAGMEILQIRAASDSPGSEFELWAETNGGWKFQGKLKVSGKEFSDYEFPVRETLGKDIKYIRILAANPGGGRFTIRISSLKFIAQPHAGMAK